MKRTGEEELRRILARNLPPEVRKEEIARLKREMRIQADAMPRYSPPEDSLPGMLLRQIPYITTWVWTVQIGAVVFFALLYRDFFESREPLLLMSLTGPVLALLLVVDLMRSFGCNMWEMEAACRHDLRQLTAMRMCIVGAADTAVLAAGCALYGKKEGNIWEYALFVVLPFLISSSVYLWELKLFPKKYGGYVLAVTGIVLAMIGTPALRMIHGRMLALCLDRAPRYTAGALAIFGIITICTAVRLCGGLKSGKRGMEKWSLE